MGGAVSPQSESGERGELEQAADGTYLIYTAENLKEFAVIVNGTDSISADSDADARLMNDIDLSSVCGENIDGGPVSWTPIGTSSQQYRGTFNGANYTISGLYINSSSANDQGLFGYVGTGGTVKDLSVSGDINGGMYVGGVAGDNSGTVTNCAFSGSVSGSWYVGGVVGYNSSTVENCYNTGAVNSSGNYVGGVVGYNYIGGSVTNCYNTGAVNSSGNRVGGVVGYNISSVTNCYNTGTVTGTGDYVGGVVGYNISSTVENCYNIGKVTGSAASSNVGGVVGYNNGGSVTDCYFLKDTAEKGIGKNDGSGDAAAVNDLNALCENFESVTDTWTIHSVLGRPVLNENKEGGDGSPDSPYEISTADQLENFRDLVNGANGNPAAWAVLMENIDLSEICGESAGNWTPIGTNSSRYSGNFNGQNFKISGLYIKNTSSDTDYQGLFGYLGTSGDNKGTVQNLSVSGTVNSSGDYVGGVVGYNNGGTVTGCIFSGSGSGSVSGYSNAVGGVVGWNDSGANVENCYNTGSVNVIGNSSAVGGVVGYNGSSSTVENCYNTGSVTSSDSPVGGGVGYNISSVTNCYNTGTVSGSGGHVDGVVGDNRGTVKNCYYQIDKGAIVGIGGTTADDTTTVAKTAEQFASGEVAYLLQSNQTDGSSQVWGQTLGGEEDSLPTLVALNPGAAQPVYKVTFKYGYEGAPEEKISYSNGSVEFPAFERTGYTLAGWTPTGTTISQDTTFTAQWTANTYTVTLHTNDGTIAEDQNVTTYTYGIGATLPTTVTREGYTFEGWYEKEDLTGDPVTEIGKDAIGDKAYWAKWKANEYKVTLHTNDDTIAEGQNISSYTYGIGATLPTSVTREGYTFAGWYEKEDFTGDPVAAIGKDAMGDKTYWAKWEEVENPEPEPTPTPTPTPDPEPSGPSTGDSTGWDDIRDELENTAKGDEITIDMGDETKVPAEIFETLAGQDITLEIALEGGVTWTVNGQDIPADANLDDLDLGVEMDSDGIPVDVVNSITGERDTVQMTLAHDGEFGFTMTLSAPLGEENAGYWANLYHYDEEAEKLNFETAAEIDADGSVTIPFSHASQYAIVIDTHSHAAVDVSDLFIDIAPDAWYKDAIQYAYDNGLMAGVSATEFDPEATTTRAMIVSILARLENVTTAQAAGFADVDDNDWYATAVNWAANVGVVNGYEDNTFRPNTAITREQLAAILMNYAACIGQDVSNRADLANYTDQPSTWAEEAISWSVAEGLLTGVTADTLQPQGAATRAQVAAILQRFLSE